jgi:hypothetical protein
MNKFQKELLLKHSEYVETLLQDMHDMISSDREDTEYGVEVSGVGTKVIIQKFRDQYQIVSPKEVRYAYSDMTTDRRSLIQMCEENGWVFTEE